MTAIGDIIRNHKATGEGGIFSVCSANPYVIEAALLHAKLWNVNHLVIEATCNQVNQFGGYSGMKPENFIRFVKDLSQKIQFPCEKIIFGGDHLGPNPWQDENSAIAIENARDLVISYVNAGFKKIHIDCSIACKDDILPLSDEVIAKRAAYLISAAEDAAKGKGDLNYIIGSEVPVPGGASEVINSLAPTQISSVSETIAAHKAEFAAQNLDHAFAKTIAIVVQPGVEFDNHLVHDFAPAMAKALSQFIENEAIVYEAHSTDYQTKSSLKALVQGHFAILKVGPALSYAMREAIWALDMIDSEIYGTEALNVREFIIEYLRKNPKYWAKYYENDENLNLALQYGLSDRIRYYWPDEAIQRAVSTLIHRLGKTQIPFGLLKQYLPNSLQVLRACAMEIAPHNLILGQIMAVLDDYLFACEGLENA